MVGLGKRPELIRFLFDFSDIHMKHVQDIMLYVQIIKNINAHILSQIYVGKLLNWGKKCMSQRYKMCQ